MMQTKKFKTPVSNVDDLLAIIDSVFSDINIGFMIYHIEEPTDESRLKLLYANQEASEYTETDLQKRVGKYIFDAFPPLKETELPKVYLEVGLKKEARQVGVVEYSDQQIRQGAFSVKAFPLPANCVGIIFEDIAIRKHVDDLVKKRTQKLSAESAELSQNLQEILSKSQSLRKSLAKSLSPENTKILDQIIEIAGRASQ